MRAIFFDRDGVLNHLVMRDGAAVSPREVEEFVISADAAEATRKARALGYLVIVVTNQPDIARGRMRQSTLDAMHEQLRAALDVDELVWCPHDDADACACRKPLPGLLQETALRRGVDLGTSWLIGDSWRDVVAGARAGCRTIFLGPAATLVGFGARADFCAAGLAEAMAIIEHDITTP